MGVMGMSDKDSDLSHEDQVVPMATLRLVFCDMDSTFLADDKSIPRDNAMALDLLAERDVGFVPCTGRAWSAVPAEVLDHPAVRYVIAANGAIVRDVRSKRTLRATLIGARRALALFGRVRDISCTFDVFSKGASRANATRFGCIRDFGIDAPTVDWLLGRRVQLSLPTEGIINAYPDVEKITMYFGDDDARQRIIAAAEMDPSLCWTSSHPYNVEVMDGAASKGAALSWLCRWLHVSLTDVVAFGDSPNDLSMLEAAGDGVAMANASSEVKAVAKHVTRRDNGQGGVGEYLRERYFVWRS